MASDSWQNYQQFILTLDKAIEQNRENFSQCSVKVDQALSHWKEKKIRLQALQTLQERQSTATMISENRLDQKKMDEFAQPTSLRKSE